MGTGQKASQERRFVFPKRVRVSKSSWLFDASLSALRSFMDMFNKEGEKLACEGKLRRVEFRMLESAPSMGASHV